MKYIDFCSPSRLAAFAALLFILFIPLSSSAQTIAEKKASFQRTTTGGAELDPQTQALLNKINLDLSLKKGELRSLYARVMILHKQDALPEQFQELLFKINSLKASIAALDEQWLEGVSQTNEGDGYALWHQPETTLEQLIIDYGSQDYVYLMSPEISGIKLSINSNLPIPRASWSDMLELILKQNGVGIRQLNPYLRELFLLNQQSQPVNVMTNRREDLELFPRDARIAYMLTPDPSDVRRIWFFLEKFVNPNTTVVQQVGRDILIIGQVGDIQDLLKLYDFIVTNRSDKEYRLVALTKIKAEEMASILTAVFDQLTNVTEQEKNDRPSKGSEETIEDTNGLKVIILSSMSQALFLVGTREEITKAENMVRDLEQQVGGATEKVINWYVVKHSVPEELADMLQKIYSMMIRERIGRRQMQHAAQFGMHPLNAMPGQQGHPPAPPPMTAAVEAPVQQLPPDLYRDPFYEQGAVAVNPAPITLVPVDNNNRPPKALENFIVDPKSGAIVMVVEPDLLPRLLEIVRKLDVPKKMVQIEVLLFEKKINDSTNFGLNLLRIGGQASNTRLNSMTFNNLFPIGCGGPVLSNLGVLEFAFSRMRGNGIPAYDIIYRFLLSQDDVQINANPSILTINQTPATLAIIEELSINTGIYEVDTTNGTSLKDSFTRAQYGITMEITPTIHMRDDSADEWNEWDNDFPDYITLNTTVNFDTIQHNPLAPNRPNVTRRNIHNETLIPDGETVILGGLRSKTTHDTRDVIPFLGEIPGFGKLFSLNNMNDVSTEMFIFITPKIVVDPCEDLNRIRYEQLLRRPGDLPDFLKCLNEARNWERHCTYVSTMRMLFGRRPDGYHFTDSVCNPKIEVNNDCGMWEGEYDGEIVDGNTDFDGGLIEGEYDGR